MHALDAACDVAQNLNHTLRRLRHYRTQGDWINALLDGASHFAHQSAVLAVQDGVLTLLGARNLSLPEDLSFNLASAPGFRTAFDSNDPVICLRTPGEVTAFFSTPEPGSRAHIFAITNGTRVAAVLFASAHPETDVNALELIAGMASIVLDRQSNASLHAQIATPVRN